MPFEAGKTYQHETLGEIEVVSVDDSGPPGEGVITVNLTVVPANLVDVVQWMRKRREDPLDIALSNLVFEEWTEVV